MNNLSAWRQDDELMHIIEDYENGEFEMSTIEIRGDFQVTIEPGREIWQLRYTDGTLGEGYVITDVDLTLIPDQICKGCNRRWSPSDRNIRYDNTDGRLVCPECQESVLVHSANCICGSCPEKMSIG